MKLTIITAYPPLPATDGGRLDIWHRLRALHQYGVRIQLIVNNDEAIDEAHWAALRAICERTSHFRPKRGLGYWARCATLLADRPFFVARRAPSPRERADLCREIEGFGPAAILVESLDNAALGAELAEALGLAFFIRSHNIEHRYKRRQFELSAGLRRVRSLLDLMWLERFERNALRTADAFFDISILDIDYWRREGLTTGVWLPPIMAAAPVEPPAGVPEFDVAFIGNLWAPNNVEGVEWLLRSVRPLLDETLGRRSRVLIAGSRPTAAVKALCDAEADTVLQPDFADALSVMRMARVLVNPMLSGSGVALKTLDMLRSGRPVISTGRGCAGLPEDVTAWLRVAETPKAFADAIAASLASPRFEGAQVAAVNERFGLAAIRPLVERLSDLAGKGKRPPPKSEAAYPSLIDPASP